ncbi:hypothetical protein SAMN04488516_11741 [Desulfonauticus submarinus]|uniref:Uncharacterized protein n=1 Tax=Desulfonauticus submarinus TaxID=206665 RepID=A0A1H0GC51_9BACT|nr:hypothetical protein [Desulfonauticus submarinus]SDO04477.1 hypothetical protein SAMN04488516_11741 [Desulfonauticus submarinus]
MALEIEDIKFFRSQTVTDTSENGGRMDELSEVIDNVKYNLFPRVSYKERIEGIIRYRKEFIANRNEENEQAYNLLYCIIKPSNGGDRFYITNGSYLDTQEEIGKKTDWYGAGKVQENIQAGATQIKILFEADDFSIKQPGIICITDDNNICFVKTKENKFNTEIYPNNKNASFNLQNKILPNIKLTYTINNETYSIRNSGDKFIGPEIQSSEINFSEGTGEIVFSSVPQSPIFLEYFIPCFFWEGNSCTIDLAEQIPFNFNKENSYAGMCLELGDLKPEILELNVISANGNLDKNKIEVSNFCVYDEWQIVFRDSLNFSCVGAYEGTLIQGNINIDYSPINPKSQKPFFTIKKEAWSGSFQAGDKINFCTKPAAAAVWWKEVVPANTPREPQNIVVAELYLE